MGEMVRKQVYLRKKTDSVPSMLVLHSHWQPPNHPAESGGVLFWAEMTEGPPPAWQRGRLPKNPKPKAHPYCAPVQAFNLVLDFAGEERSETLRLPSTRTGPRPSPELIHTWDLDEETPPFLAPWIVRGLWLPTDKACLALLALTTHRGSRAGLEGSFTSGADARFWHQVSALALETLAAQKLVPVLVLAGSTSKSFHARWLPVLDGPKDGPRLAQLEAVMPPVCRSASHPSRLNRESRSRTVSESKRPVEYNPRDLLTSFLNTTCDALARRFGGSAAPQFLHPDTPAHQWLKALFTDDPTVKASPAQLQSLAASHRAWMRFLHVAGDSAFRIAFRLEAPDRSKKSDWQLHYLLQARDDPSLLVPAGEVWKRTSGVLPKLGRRFEQPQEKLLAGLGYAARLFPPITGSLQGKRPTHLALETQAAYSFLRETAPILEGAGFGLLIPPWWNRPGARLGLHLRIKPRLSQGNANQGRMTLENLIHYRWELSLGETTLTEEEFLALVALKSPLVQIRGQWVQLDSEQIEAAIHFWEKQQVEGEMDLLEALQFSLGGQTTEASLQVDEIIPEGWLAEMLEQIRQPDKVVELPQPASLRGELRPYQRFGFSWLHFHRRLSLGACLADDMGLGKTVQTIALLLWEKETLGSLPAPTILVCPTSVVTNWEREIQRFAPSLTTHIHQGMNRLRGSDFIHAAKEVDVVLTSYALARQDAETMQAVSWLGVVLDEAQNIKNPTAKQTQAVRKLHSDFRLALTGTPVENRLSELWSIMHFLNPGYLGPRQKFRAELALPIERYQDEEALNQLRKLTGPFILRRLKTDPRVIQDLPEKVETKVYCHLSDEQATLYEAVVQDAMTRIEAQEEGIERRGLVLSMLMQLKQICNHPLQYLHEGGKDGEVGTATIKGRSSKLERLTELLEEILAAGDRALIFTQFAEMGKILVDYLPRAVGAPALFLHGGTPAKARDQIVRRFQEHEHSPPVFILSLKAGGTGLNLTRANHVFHFDRWWNPAVEDQATDRAFRIGQKRNVQVHKFVTTGTLEEMIDDMIESKKGLAQAVIGSSEGWLTELSTEALREVVKLRR